MESKIEPVVLHYDGQGARDRHSPKLYHSIANTNRKPKKDT